MINLYVHRKILCCHRFHRKKKHGKIAPDSSRFPPRRGGLTVRAGKRVASVTTVNCHVGQCQSQCGESHLHIQIYIYIYIHLKVLYETRYYSLFRSFPFSQHCQCQSHFTCNPQVCFGSSRCDMYIASDQYHHWSAAWQPRLEPAQQVSPNALKSPKHYRNSKVRMTATKGSWKKIVGRYDE